LSVAPLEAWASAEEVSGRLVPARRLYVRAVELQPLNWEPWYQLALFDRDVLGNRNDARREFRRANELDPHGCAPLRALGRPCD
jgi:Flp pilus assembly protein TadD